VRHMIGFDLFAGAGGLSLGAVQAGIDVRLAVESDIHASSTYSFNHPDTTVYSGDIRDLKEVKIDTNGQSSVLFGGPPCQGFSTSNQKTRGLNNSKNWLFKEFLRIVKLWGPDWVVFENVTGIISTEGGFFLNSVLNELKSLGYTVTTMVLNSLEYGVPQNRSRFFAVASLNNNSINKPEPTVEKHTTVSMAINDLPDLPNGASINIMPHKCKSQDEFSSLMRCGKDESTGHLVSKNADYVVRRYKYIPQGGNWQNIPLRLMTNYSNLSRCHTGIYHRLRADKPAVVIGNYRKNMLIHPTQDRGLSVREAARLQSFPDWYEFKGGLGCRQQQVGNAVPPLLAEALFKEIIKSNSETHE